MKPSWRLPLHDEVRIGELSRTSRVSPLVAQLLLRRGVGEAEQAREFLAARMGSLHDPQLLPGVPQAAELIDRAIKAGRPIVIYGDYDVDGACGVSILWQCLRLAGVKRLAYYIPHRVEEGYGLNARALEMLADEHPGAVVVTVDCGISAVAEAAHARKLGLELVITDHHTIGQELPAAAVLVHPRLPGSLYPNGDICGAGVAFKLAWEVCKRFGDGKRASPHLRSFLVEALEYVALATIADVVPLSGENRVLVRHGLKGLETAPTVGAAALLEIAGHVPGKPVKTGNISFGLAPRINAAGRMEKASAAVQLLTTDSPETARQLAAELDACNTRRQEVERAIEAQAHEQIKSWGGIGALAGLVVAGADWHPGVIGIVAGRLAETYHRPTVVVALSPPIAQGSARSIPGFNLHDAVAACSDFLEAFGGHAAAAGMKLDPRNLAAFAQRFDEECKRRLTHEQLRRTCLIDAEVPFDWLTLPVVEQMEQLEPHGIGNPRPLLLASDVEVVGPPQTFGKAGEHVGLTLRQGNCTIRSVGWRKAEKWAGLMPGARVSLVFHASINEWNGRRHVRIEIEDLELEPCEHGRGSASRGASAQG